MRRMRLKNRDRVAEAERYYEMWQQDVVRCGKYWHRCMWFTLFEAAFRGEI